MGVTTDAILAEVARYYGFRRMTEHPKLRNVWIMDLYDCDITQKERLVVAFDEKTGRCHLSGNFLDTESPADWELKFNVTFKEIARVHMKRLQSVLG